MKTWIAMIFLAAPCASMACEEPITTMASLIVQLERAIKAVESRESLARALSLNVQDQRELRQQADVKLSELRALVLGQGEDLLHITRESALVQRLIEGLENGSALQVAPQREYPKGVRAREIFTRFEDDWDLI